MHLNNKLIAFKQRHTNERNSFGLVHGYTSHLPVPIHRGFVDVEDTLAAVCQKGTTTPAPHQTELGNDGRWQTKPPIKPRVDDRFYLLFLSGRTIDSEADNRFAAAVTTPVIMPPVIVGRNQSGVRNGSQSALTKSERLDID